MHSAGLELTKLTYTRIEGNQIRHRGDRFFYFFFKYCYILLYTGTWYQAAMYWTQVLLITY